MRSSLAIYLMLALSIATIETAAKAQTATPEIRFPDENQVNQSTRPSSSAPMPWSDPPLLAPASPAPAAIGPAQGNIADQLNRAELSRLLRGGQTLRRAPFR
jgi:hypothetical protein